MGFNVRRVGDETEEVDRFLFLEGCLWMPSGKRGNVTRKGMGGNGSLPIGQLITEEMEKAAASVSDGDIAISVDAQIPAFNNAFGGVSVLPEKKIWGRSRCPHRGRGRFTCTERLLFGNPDLYPNLL